MRKETPPQIISGNNLKFLEQLFMNNQSFTMRIVAHIYDRTFCELTVTCHLSGL